MGGMMDGMMKKMGVPPPKDLYPSLMAVPELSPELRTQVEAQAGERMNAGTVLIGQALDTLSAGTQAGDYAAMHDAMTRLREGAAQLESGIAARRALAEGRKSSSESRWPRVPVRRRPRRFRRRPGSRAWRPDARVRRPMRGRCS